jgi:hypothetical protein
MNNARHSENCEYSINDNPWSICTCGVGSPNNHRAAEPFAQDERGALRPTMLSKSSFKGELTDERLLFEKTVAAEHPDLCARQIDFAWWLWQDARAASPSANVAQWESTAIANELWQLADQCGYEQFRDALSAHIKRAYQDGWQDRKTGVASVTYGEQK